MYTFLHVYTYTYMCIHIHMHKRWICSCLSFATVYAQQSLISFWGIHLCMHLLVTRYIKWIFIMVEYVKVYSNEFPYLLNMGMHIRIWIPAIVEYGNIYRNFKKRMRGSWQETWSMSGPSIIMSTPKSCILGRPDMCAQNLRHTKKSSRIFTVGSW